MSLDIRYKLFNEDKEMRNQLKDAKRKILSSTFSDKEIEGRKFRTFLINILNSEFKNEEFYLFNSDTALIIQVSHPGSAYSELLNVLLAQKKGEIKRCIFITQTHELAVIRHQIRNPDSTNDGNRIHFEVITNKIKDYAEYFFDMPIGILGIGFSNK